MGRALHTNFNARFKCEALKVINTLWRHKDIKWWFSFTISQCFVPDLVVVIEAIWAHPKRLWALKIPCLILTSFTSAIQFYGKMAFDASIWLLLKSCHIYFDIRVFLSTPSNVCTYLILQLAMVKNQRLAEKLIKGNIYDCVCRYEPVSWNILKFNQDVIIL